MKKTLTIASSLLMVATFLFALCAISFNLSQALTDEDEALLTLSLFFSIAALIASIVSTILSFKDENENAISNSLVIPTMIYAALLAIRSCVISSILASEGYVASVVFTLFIIVGIGSAIAILVSTFFPFQDKPLPKCIIYTVAGGILGFLLLTTTLYGMDTLSTVLNVLIAVMVVMVSITLFLSRKEMYEIQAAQLRARQKWNAQRQQNTQPVEKQQAGTLQSADEELRERLKSAQKLLQDGIITSEEYEAMRKKILGI